MNLNSLDIETAVASYFDWRVNMIVPNISWGLGIHECDLLIVSKAGYCTEVEIKVSKSDLKADLKKRHGHKSRLIKKLYFAIPDYLQDCVELIPARAGIITVTSDGRQRCKCIRKPEITAARKLTSEQYLHLGRLASMRIWGIKQALKYKTKAIDIEKVMF